jgi:hypothetical protein
MTSLHCNPWSAQVPGNTSQCSLLLHSHHGPMVQPCTTMPVPCALLTPHCTASQVSREVPMCYSRLGFPITPLSLHPRQIIDIATPLQGSDPTPASSACQLHACVDHTGANVGPQIDTTGPFSRKDTPGSSEPTKTSRIIPACQPRHRRNPVCCRCGPGAPAPSRSARSSRHHPCRYRRSAC